MTGNIHQITFKTPMHGLSHNFRPNLPWNLVSEVSRHPKTNNSLL